jgi:hypothetical protein
VKRPEIFEKGRLLVNTDTQSTEDSLTFVTAPINKLPVPSNGIYDIQTNIDWDHVGITGKRTLDELKDLFDAEQLYPELFDYFRNNVSGYEFKISIEKKRFLHINPPDNASGIFGCDEMVFPGDTAVSASLSGSGSLPLWINFNPAQKNNTDYEKDGQNASNMCGGFAYRKRLTDNRVVIVLQSDWLNEVDTYWDTSASQIGFGRKIGFDRHFSAYGTSCIGLYNGKTLVNYTDLEGIDIRDSATNTSNIVARASQEQFTDLGGETYFTGYDQSPYLYLGSPEPLVNFDTTLNRFTISDLYSPEFTGNFINAGETFESNPYSPSDDPGTKVYFINKRLRANSFCPDMVPYEHSRFIPYTDQDGRGYGFTSRTYLAFNNNLETNTIYDQHSGISWDTFGSDRKNWNNNSLLGLLGFDYDALHPEAPDNYQKFISFSTQTPNLGSLVTNAKETSTDVVSRPQNVTENPLYNYTLTTAGGINPNTLLQDLRSGFPSRTMYGYNLTQRTNIPAIVVENAESIQIRASNLPKKTTRPYYLIRSNIIQQNNFMAGEGQILPVIGLVNKINGYADFFSTDGDGTEFTVTKSFVLTNITTSIHQPDGRLAQVDDNSAVIYKITKNKSLTLNLSDIILQE